jgi:hypothetical protein
LSLVDGPEPNLMRYRDTLQLVPGGPGVAGTPQEVYAQYESAMRPMLMRLGAYPLAGATVLGANLLETPPELDHWSRAVVVRHPAGVPSSRC